ncbi:MAG TPA: WGR domain-containing protein [Chthoniobacterales bacterium]|jgi:bifunctional non-homologous end joining protein LigD
MSPTTLYYREGASDKVYQIALEERSTGWVVNFAYGRRGATLSTGSKTQYPVSYEQALKIHDRLVREKLAKGYTPGADATSYSGGSQEFTGVLPQLLNPVEEVELPQLLTDDSFVLQPKIDGRRLLIRKMGQSVTGINRRGIECGIPESIPDDALLFEGDFLIDGEAVGDVFSAFDLLECDEEDLRNEPYRQRLIALMTLLGDEPVGSIRQVCTFWGEQEKRFAFDRYREQGIEGVVFKRELASYSAGRPASGGNQLKFKFVTTASVIVSAINTRRSAAISLWDDTKLVPAGNVTIPPNHPLPEVGQVAEVRYLYAIPESGSLYQPVYLGLRDDIEQAECLVSQLKYKKAA